MPTPTHRLHVRRLDTVGFVDKGDDPKAEVVFFKRAETFDEAGSTERISSEMYDLTYRLVQALRSAVEDPDEDQNPADIMATSLEQFEATVRARIPMWAQGKPVEKKDADGVLAKALDALSKAFGLKGKEVEKLLADGADGGSNDDGTNHDGGHEMSDKTFDVTKLSAEAQAEFEKLTGRIAELEKAAKPEPEPKLPEPVQKAIEAAEKRAQAAEDRVQKLEDQREQEQFIAKAKDLSLNADDWATPLRKIRKALTDEEWDRFEKHQRSQAAQIRESDLFKQIGRGGSGAASPAETEVAELVKGLRDKNPGWSEERARGEVMKTRPDLRNALENERQARVGHLNGEE